MQTITLKKPMRFSLPPRALTRVALIESARTLSAMQAEPQRIPTAVITDTTETEALKARVTALETRLHQQASEAWLEAEEMLRQQRLEKLATRQHYSATAHVRDNTASATAKAAVITTDAVHVALPLNPRKAVPMELPLLSRLRNWLKGR